MYCKDSTSVGIYESLGRKSHIYIDRDLVKDENKCISRVLIYRKNPGKQEILLFYYIILSTITVSPEKLRIVDGERILYCYDTNIARYRSTTI